MKKLSRFLVVVALLGLAGCKGPSLGGEKVLKEYYTGGKVRSAFTLSDETKKNGTLRKYGYEGHLTSVVEIRNGVKHGLEKWYDKKGRIIRTVPYRNGRIDGTMKEYYKNGDILASIPYQKGIRNGQAFTYNKDGSVHKKVTFRNNKIIRSA